MTNSRGRVSFALVLGIATTVILATATTLVLLKLRAPEPPPEDPAERFQRETAVYERTIEESRSRVADSKARFEKSVRRVEILRAAGKLGPGVERIELELQSKEVEIQAKEIEGQTLASEAQIARTSEFLARWRLPGAADPPPTGK